MKLSVPSSTSKAMSTMFVAFLVLYFFKQILVSFEESVQQIFLSNDVISIFSTVLDSDRTKKISLKSFH